jgi:uncharacterized protein YlxP (DUF503 family)
MPSKKRKRKPDELDLYEGDQITYSFGLSIDIGGQWVKFEFGIAKAIRDNEDPQEVLENIIEFVEYLIEEKRKQVTS